MKTHSASGGLSILSFLSRFASLPLAVHFGSPMRMRPQSSEKNVCREGRKTSGGRGGSSVRQALDTNKSARDRQIGAAETDVRAHNSRRMRVADGNGCAAQGLRVPPERKPSAKARLPSPFAGPPMLARQRDFSGRAGLSIQIDQILSRDHYFCFHCFSRFDDDCFPPPRPLALSPLRRFIFSSSHFM